jgi:hypothetical protein
VPGTHSDPAPGTSLLELAERARPLTLAAEQVLEVDPALAPVLPDLGLRCGTTVVVGGCGGLGATSLVLALLARPSAKGRWCAVVGLPALGPVAAEELDVDLTHLALVPAPGRQWATVTAALLDGLDVVVVQPPQQVRPSDARRLMARARQRRAVLVVLAPSAELQANPAVPPDAAGVPRRLGQHVMSAVWPGFDLCLAVTGGEWVGPGTGFGHLRSRRVDVTVWGRGAAARAAHHFLWLPAEEGGVRIDPSPGDPPSARPFPDSSAAPLRAPLHDPVALHDPATFPAAASAARSAAG